MRRFELTDGQDQRIAPHLPGKPEDPGTTARDNRLFLDAVLRIARTGAPWPDLPERFGKHDSVYQRFNRRSKSGRWLAIMEAPGGDADLEHLLIDSTVIRAHQHAAGARKKAASRRSAARGAGGARVTVDALGNPVRLLVTGGQVADVARGGAGVGPRGRARDRRRMGSSTRSRSTQRRPRG